MCTYVFFMHIFRMYAHFHPAFFFMHYFKMRIIVATDLDHLQRDSLQSGSGEREPERERCKDLDRDLEQRRPRVRGGEREDERELEREDELLPECLYLKSQT